VHSAERERRRREDGARLIDRHLRTPVRLPSRHHPVDEQEASVSEHGVEVVWTRDGRPFGERYDRSHVWRFDGGVEVPASSAPGLWGDPSRVDPEEAFVAAISSCHMLWFLYLAAKRGLVVDRYVDAAVGVMQRTERGVSWITDVDLRPVIEWSGEAPAEEVVVALHHESHERCFIANSVRSRITVHGA
jgi:organic hydroperoxide reductase OsmC/OhrA